MPNFTTKTENNKCANCPCVDVFKWRVHNKDVQLACKKHRQQFFNCYYKFNEMFPLKKHKFDDIQLWGAYNPIPYLDRYYGKDWPTIARVDVKDDKGFKSGSVLFRLTPES